jgi:3-phosphoshikimate 1-carboxyvinyltransferase
MSHTSFQTSHSLQGAITVAGDKSISHRSLMLASQALGTCRIRGLLEGEDVLATKAALEQIGADIRREGDDWLVQGKGLGALHEPAGVLDLGNSGTSVRLLMGLLAAYPFTSFFTGDESLRRRPMGRVVEPLTQMGAKFLSHTGNRLPCALTGGALLPLTYRLPVPSAQVKSAIILAGLNTAGKTTVIEPEPSRDHTERMLQFFGFPCVTEAEGTGKRITITGQHIPERKDRVIDVPSDPSSAAFPMVAALLVPDSTITLHQVGMNPYRTGLFTTLQEMGASLEFSNHRQSGGEEVADITVSTRPLRGVVVPAERAPSMIDEYPILAIAAAFAEGVTVMHGLAELRVKESNRLDKILQGLLACGVRASVEGDTLTVIGNAGGKVTGGVTIDSALDHRIAMSFLILGLRSEKSITVTGVESIATSFPNFFAVMQAIGVKVVQSASSAMTSPLRHPLVIAIDGPAASGKGTLGRRLADTLGIVYLDTGSLYRAVGMRLVYAGKDPHDKQEAVAAAREITLQDLQNPRLRQEHIGKAASVVSAFAEVREALLEFQHNIAANPHGAVLDGRDIGTVICPNADVKFFITASIETRAKRRHRELEGEGVKVIYDSVLEDLRERDERDSHRAAAPLIAAQDAIVIDTSELSAEEVFAQVLHAVQGVAARLAA